ncbi:MAG: carbonic anhydrase [Planctomycetota bacterium]|nr:carbonic anhydrase [Planctomycetota bacterium]
MNNRKASPFTYFSRTDSPSMPLILVALVTLTLAFAPNETPSKDAPSTPDEAVAAVMAGNARFVNGQSTAHTIETDRAQLASGQAPFAAVIRCADSRVAPEICFDQPLGQLFVCAVAGNVPTLEGIASLEYGVAVLGTKLIVVMGHSECGAVGAAIEHREDTSVLPGSLPGLIDQIVSPCALAVDPSDADALKKATACNAAKSVTQLLKRSNVIKEAVAKGDLRLIAGVQDLGTGVFTLVKK